MRVESVPQDGDTSHYDGHKRLCYATDTQGRYVRTLSSGWEVETTATDRALARIERDRRSALEAVARGKRTPLHVHLVDAQTTPTLLARSAGLPTILAWLALRPATARLLPRAAWRRLAHALAWTGAPEALKGH